MQRPQVDIISRETVKPSTPTPQDHRIHILSYMDRFQAPTYLPLLYFYTSNSTKFGSASTENYLPKLNHLKRSLAETLAKYYPFAGRIRDDANVNCSDDGVTLVEARIKCKMSQVLDDPQDEILDFLSVDGLPWETLNSTLISTSSLLIVQISLFDCGGIAIGVCLNHKLGGAATLVKFITDWATIAQGDRDQVCPELTAAANTFPSDGLPVLNSEFSPTFPNVSPTKRFVFDASKIAALKAQVADKVHKPTRTEVVTALIYKCAISALGTLTNSSTSTSTNISARFNPDAPFTTTYLYQIMDLSARLTPPMPESCVGNATWTFLAASNDCNKVELHDIVLQMREAKNRFLEKYMKRLSGKEWPSVMREWLQQLGEVFTKIDLVNDEILFRCSSWCRFPVYEVDFGWGNPTWVTIPSHNLKRNFYLIDARDGEGVEAFVNLTAEHMDVVESDPEFLAFATLNPPVNI